MNIKEMFKNKGLGYWICTGAAVASFIMAIIIFATGGNAFPRPHNTTGYVAGIVMLLPILVQAFVTFFPVRFSALISVIVQSIALGTVILKIPEAIADHINNVAYQGGNFGMCIFYLVAAILLVIACIAGCFFEQLKEEKYII